MRNLRAELLSTGKKTSSLQPSCVLRGYRDRAMIDGLELFAEGFHVHARLSPKVSNCPLCYGKTRLVENGISTPCTTPSPAHIAGLVNSACIPARYADANLEHFNNFTGNGREVLTAVRNWFDQHREKPAQGFLLSGQIGVGKTYLLAAMAKQLIFQGISVRFVEFFELLNELKAGYAEEQADRPLLLPLMEVDVLIIDELGKGRRTDWELTILDQLVTGRYNQRKPIVASSNFSLRRDGSLYQNYNIDLERDLGAKSQFAPDVFDTIENQVGQRIWSRLVETCTMLELRGQDVRKAQPSS